MVDCRWIIFVLLNFDKFWDVFVNVSKCFFILLDLDVLWNYLIFVLELFLIDYLKKEMEFFVDEDIEIVLRWIEKCFVFLEIKNLCRIYYILFIVEEILKRYIYIFLLNKFFYLYNI